MKKKAKNEPNQEEELKLANILYVFPSFDVCVVFGYDLAHSQRDGQTIDLPKLLFFYWYVYATIETKQKQTEKIYEMNPSESILFPTAAIKCAAATNSTRKMKNYWCAMNSQNHVHP